MRFFKSTFIFTFLLLFCTSFRGLAQKTLSFSIIDAVTGQPIQGLWLSILKDRCTISNGSFKYENGIYYYKTRDADTTGTYQVEISNHYNKVTPGIYDITDKTKQIKVYVTNNIVPFMCSSASFGVYTPETIYSIADLPKSVQLKLKSSLIKRVGLEFYKRIELNAGTKFDLDRLYKLDSSARSFKYTPSAYILCMSILDATTCAEIFSFEIGLKKTGQLAGKICLPDIKHNSQKHKVLTQQQARVIAAKYGFQLAEVSGVYDDKVNSLAWDFKKADRPGGGEVLYTTLRIDAHSGKIISKQKAIHSVIID